MHDTAYLTGSSFISAYASSERRVIVEIGSMDINGSLRDACPQYSTYVGLDVEHGKGVDIKIDPSMPLPLRDGFGDLTISTSQMEHDPRFWLTFLELCRITRHGGLIYMSAPSNGAYHCHPIDAWRFYPDAGHALVKWAKDHRHAITLIESFTMPRHADQWNDFVAIFQVGEPQSAAGIDFLSDRLGAYNVWKYGRDAIERPRTSTEDQDLLVQRTAERDRLQAELDLLRGQLADSRAATEKLTAELAQALQGQAAAATPGEQSVLETIE